MTNSVESLAGLREGVPERFVPAEMHGQLVEAEHLARYLWATRFATGRRVLDAGCGVGYGSALLAAAGAESVEGVDASEAVITVAEEQAGERVSFAVGDIAALPHGAHSFDLIVAFEVIEHVEDPELVLDELARLLAPDGLLLISSPHREHYVPGNPHHVREFQPQELRAALEPRFETVRLLDQHLMLASVLSEPTHQPELRDGELHRVAHAAGEDGIYTLAMAGGRLPDPGPALAALGPFTEFRLQLEHMSAQEEHIARQQRRIDELEVTERTRLHALRRVAELETEQSRLVDQLAKQELELEAARRRVARVERQIGAITSSRTWRYTGSLRALVRRLRDG